MVSFFYAHFFMYMKSPFDISDYVKIMSFMFTKFYASALFLGVFCSVQSLRVWAKTKFFLVLNCLYVNFQPCEVTNYVFTCILLMFVLYLACCC